VGTKALRIRTGNLFPFPRRLIHVERIPLPVVLLSHANPAITPATRMTTNRIRNKKPNIIILIYPFLLS
jgi:hypothetical protein